MLPYTTKGQSENERDSQELNRSCIYDLLSVVEHVGEIDTGESLVPVQPRIRAPVTKQDPIGHYVSYCRVGDQVSSHSDLSAVVVIK